MRETWLPVKGYEGLYEVSDFGRVRSLDRVRLGGKPLPGKVLKPGKVNVLGHLKVNLMAQGVLRSVLVHHLVLEAFVAARLPGAESRHLDGDPSNNTPGNLSWGTSSANNYDQVWHGTHPESSRTRCLRGHEMREPNLVGYELPSRRRCLSCERARGYAKNRREPFSKERADMYYSKLEMG